MLALAGLNVSAAPPKTPIDQPIDQSSSPAPAVATACSCRLYDEHGLILETSTHLEDILMSDYFQIDDRCVVQPGQDGSAVRVDVEVEVRKQLL